LFCALDDLIGPYYEVAIVGDTSDDATQALVSAVNSRFLPRLALAIGAPGDTEVPLLENRALLDGQPAAYVCQGFVCQRPVTAPADLLAQLGV
ncbi:MAG TPA: thioredoxin domain-containing protein, partial [Ktedonobacterales bacterium]